MVQLQSFNLEICERLHLGVKNQELLKLHLSKHILFKPKEESSLMNIKAQIEKNIFTLSYNFYVFLNKTSWTEVGSLARFKLDA